MTTTARTLLSIGLVLGLTLAAAGSVGAQTKREQRRAERLLAKLRLVDGSGSGLDADTLRGMTAEQLGGEKLDQLLALVTELSAAVAALRPGPAPEDRQLRPWHRALPPAERFEDAFGGAAVLDNETGLVWEKAPSTVTRTWPVGLLSCQTKILGERLGWRLPRWEELATLLDRSQSLPALPSGHPFTGVQSGRYWAATGDVVVGPTRGCTDCVVAIDLGTGQVALDQDRTDSNFTWCVRGPGGGDLLP